MIFNQILFYYDMNGKYLAEDKSDGSFIEKPRILKAEHCNARYFDLTNTRMRGNRGDVSGVHISRHYGPLKKDPYNEDGRPPTCMFRMAIPHIEFCCGIVTIEGLEEPNLCWAGLLVPPYSHNYKLIKGAAYMTEEEKEGVHFRQYEKHTRQRIELRCTKGLK